jgi:ribosome-binding factor A
MDFDQNSGRRGRRARSRGEASAPGVRSLRLERVFAEELSWLLRNEVLDELFVGADVARVDLSADLRRAHVVVALPVDHPAPERAASEGASSALARVFRAHIAESLDLKRIPTFRVAVRPHEPDDEGAGGGLAPDDEGRGEGLAPDGEGEGGAP